MRVLPAALTGVALAAAFAAGMFVGRRPAPPPPFRAYEIREGRAGFLNPLLECEVHDPHVETETRPFGAALESLARRLEQDAQVTRVAVYYRDLDNGPWAGYREREEFFPASLAKVPIVLACLRRAETDPGFLSRRLVNTGSAEEKVPGFMNPEVNLGRGVAYSVEELILRIAQYSDNAAARLLAEAVGPAALANVYADLGLTAAHGGGVAQMSPKEYGALFRILYNASYLNRANSALALEWFTRSTFELGLVAGAPQDVVVSHKFGVWEGLGDPAPLQLHDCGVVYHPGGPYLLCVMTAGGNYVRMAAAIAEVSRFVYRQVDSTSLRPAPAAR